jgi:hypothetical protein
MRDGFTEATARKIAQEAMYFCANPGCLRLTGYGTTKGEPRSIAEAAHIIAASAGGPRSSSRATKATRASATNGIWLCKICHKIVDNDAASYSVAILREWKKSHRKLIQRVVGKDIEAALLELRASKRYQGECRELLSFFDSKRVFYEGLDHECPPMVLDSLNIIRTRITDVRGRISPDSELFSVLDALERVVHNFLRNIGADTNLNELRCDGRDPRWVKFSEELIKLRKEFSVLLQPLAASVEYELDWITR